MISLLVRAIAAGVPIGLQLGLTGTGGAILGLPLMIYIVGVSVQQAAAMSLIIVAISSLVGAWEYNREGFVKIKAAAVFGWAGMLGAWGGALGHRLVREEVLLISSGYFCCVREQWLRTSGRYRKHPNKTKAARPCFRVPAG